MEITHLDQVQEEENQWFQHSCTSRDVLHQLEKRACQLLSQADEYNTMIGTNLETLHDEPLELKLQYLREIKSLTSSITILWPIRMLLNPDSSPMLLPCWKCLLLMAPQQFHTPDYTVVAHFCCSFWSHRPYSSVRIGLWGWGRCWRKHSQLPDYVGYPPPIVVGRSTS